MAEDKNQAGSQETYKQLLDRQATGGQQSGEGHNNPIVEKITEYIPQAAKFLGAESKDEQSKTKSEGISGPPDRPHHDDKIEEFVRDQHRSKMDDGTLNPASQAEK